jgi:hypothetical protein
MAEQSPPPEVALLGTRKHGRVLYPQEMGNHFHGDQRTFPGGEALVVS